MIVFTLGALSGCGESSSATFSMRSIDTIGATKQTLVGTDRVEPSGVYEVACVSGHGYLGIEDTAMYVLANDEYLGTEYSGLIYEQSIRIELNGSDKLLSRYYNSSEFKLEFKKMD